MESISAEMWTVVGAALALAAIIVPGQNAMRRDIAEIRGQIAELRERMAHLEGSFDGFTKRGGAPEA